MESADEGRGFKIALSYTVLARKLSFFFYGCEN